MVGILLPYHTHWVAPPETVPLVLSGFCGSFKSLSTKKSGPSPTEVLGDVHFELWWVHLAAGVVHAQVQEVTEECKASKARPWVHRWLDGRWGFGWWAEPFWQKNNGLGKSFFIINPWWLLGENYITQFILLIWIKWHHNPLYRDYNRGLKIRILRAHTLLINRDPYNMIS